MATSEFSWHFPNFRGARLQPCRNVCSRDAALAAALLGSQISGANFSLLFFPGGARLDKITNTISIVCRPKPPERPSSSTEKLTAPSQATALNPPEFVLSRHRFRTFRA